MAIAGDFLLTLSPSFSDCFLNTSLRNPVGAQHVHASFLRGVPEELPPDPEGSLIGGGLCFTPFPKTDVWTSGEIPSPCR